MGALPASMSVYHVHVCYLQRLKKGAGSPGFGVTNDCKLPRIKPKTFGGQAGAPNQSPKVF